MLTLRAIWKWDEQRCPFTLHCIAPVVQTSSVEHNTNVFEERAILVTALLFPAEVEIKSRWPRNLGSGSYTVPQGLRAILRRKHPWHVFLWSAEGQRVRGTVVSFLHRASDPDHATLCRLPCLVRKSLVSSFQLYWMPWKRWTSLGTAFSSVLYSSFQKWRTTKHFLKQLMGCFKSEILCARGTREPESGSNVFGFGKHFNKPGSETWLQIPQFGSL